MLPEKKKTKKLTLLLTTELHQKIHFQSFFFSDLIHTDFTPL